MADKMFKIASFPTPNNDTYYFWLYYDALSKFGYELVDTKGKGLTKNWLDDNKDKVDILHFHWPAYIYSKKSIKGFIDNLKNFIGLLLYAKSLGYKIAWTVHNLFPHERNNLLLEYIARFMLARIADVVFIHFESARTDLSRLFLRRKNVHVIPHGDFRAVFQNTNTKQEAREQLDVPLDSFTYLIFGPVRPYKGVEEAIHAFEQVASKNDLLMIVGNPSDKEVAEFVRNKAQNNLAILPFLRFIDKDEVHLFFEAADVVLLPYKKIFTSGNLFLALTFGRPVVCPDMGVISEVVDCSCGFKYLPDDGSGLVRAMKAIRSANYDDLAKGAEVRGRLYRWEDAAKISADAFNNVLSTQ